jgi:hypothetical protein
MPSAELTGKPVFKPRGTSDADNRTQVGSGIPQTQGSLGNDISVLHLAAEESLDNCTSPIDRSMNIDGIKSALDILRDYEAGNFTSFKSCNLPAIKGALPPGGVQSLLDEHAMLSQILSERKSALREGRLSP